MIFGRKALGIEIGRDGARMVHVAGQSHSPNLLAYQEVSFPPDTLRIALKEENVVDAAQFVTKVREAHLKLLAGTSRISVSLPDAAGHVHLLDLETRFRTKEEGINVIRWKLKKNFPLDINEMHLDYQVLREKENGDISVLVSLISRRVVKQYEELLAEAGLQPNRIDFTTFNLFRYFSSRLENMGNAAFIVHYSDTLSIMMFTDGVLDFFRSKEFLSGPVEANRLYREISNSFLFYRDSRPGWSLNDVFFVSPQDNVEIMRAVIAEATALDPILLDASRIVTRNEGPAPAASTLHDLAAAVGAATRNL
jgi:type IV pilus assembly protein PilM